MDHNLRKSHMLPVVILADPMQRTKYEKAARNGNLQEEEAPFWSIQVPYKVDKVMPKMMNAFFDGKLVHAFQTQNRPAISFVKELNSDQFIS